MAKNPQKRAVFSRLLLPLFLLFLLFLWEFSAQNGTINTLFYSAPSLVWEKFLYLTDNGLLQKHSLTTLEEAFWGLVWGASLGSISGLGLAISPSLGKIVMPLMVGLQSVPKLALAPLIILWFGIGITSKILISAMMVFFIFMFNMHSAYRAIEKSQKDHMKLLGASPMQTLRLLIWPSCLPWFMVSLRTGTSLALSGAVVGEFIGASKGLGWMINDASGRYDMTTVICTILCIIVFMALLDFSIRQVEKRLLRWRI